MRLECRAFDEAGMSAAAHVLQQLRDEVIDEVPEELLSDTAYTRVVGGNLSTPPDLPTRWHLGIWLFRELGRAVTDRAVLRLPGFWTWLAFAVFPIIRPPGSKVYEDARYILNRDDYRKRYRHLVAGPYFVFTAHETAPHLVKGLLATAPNAPGDLYEQFASRQELVTSTAVVELLTTMYFDPSRDMLKRGAGANARRLADVLMQYDVTHDFGTITTARLIDMLPGEFARFLPRQA